MPETSATPGLYTETPGLREAAARFAQRYALATLKRPPARGYYLCLTVEGLELCQADPGASGPIRVDFVSGTLDHRRRFGGGRGQPLARAVGMKSGFSPSIWDATAGLGRDAFVLASLGSEVTLCERAASLAAMLEDGLARARLNVDIGPWVESRMHLVHGDSTALLARLASPQRPDVVYLDPMYPPGKRSVLVKKEIRALQQLLGGDRDSGDLLDIALRTAARRVVVKRPGHAGWLGGRKPSASIESRKTRYDIYVTL
jgi:16S rRNA (guanine1516-N2)-methyltransferase